MTAKRFTRDEHTGYLYDNGEIVEDVMKLLNALNDENEELKQQLTDCEKFRHTVFQEISKEMSKHD